MSDKKENKRTDKKWNVHISVDKGGHYVDEVIFTGTLKECMKFRKMYIKGDW